MTKEEVLQLSEAERKRKIDECLELLKMLTATPQSDWHAGFEALLHIFTPYIIITANYNYIIYT